MLLQRTNNIEQKTGEKVIQTFSHSICATARLFSLKSLFDEKKRHIIITDKVGDQKMIESYGKTILGSDWKYISYIGDFLEAIKIGSSNIILSPHIFEMSGNLEYFEKKTLYPIRRGQVETIEDAIEKLLSLGYTHSIYPGELLTYKREGSILTLTHGQTGNTILVEWFDTEIDSIIEIDQDGKRSFRDEVWIKNESLDETIFTKTPGKINTVLLENILHMGILPEHDGGSQVFLIGCDFHPEIELLRKYSHIHFTDFHREDAISLDVSIPDIPHIDALKNYISEKLSHANIRIYTKNEKTMSDFLEYHKILGCEIISVTRSGLESCEIPAFFISDTQNLQHSNSPTLILTDDILETIFVRKRTKKSLAKNLDLLLHISPGDYVVHREHGIARFHTVIEKTLGDIRREYIELHYAGGDKIFVPLTEIYRVSKYVGENAPELTSLAGKEWERTMEKTDEELEQIASELIEIASKRTLARGITFGSFPEEEKDFKSKFPYEYTLDQREAIDEIFRDMESEYPMDRLLSGDVGFGKTEVAMNAIYKAVLSGYQVAVISPLLVLADEHYETFLDRFSPYPFRIECLTRMTSSSDEKRILEGLKNGSVDIVIGTHKLLSEHLRWKKLGLLVIDEEHKFGVSHKETIKKMRANIDILSLSATPIPRSLNLALSGLKKVSLLSTPPKKKKPIETIVSAWNEHTIHHAIGYELSRGGQIIIVHNRIRGMEQMEQEIGVIVKSEEGRMKSRGSIDNHSYTDQKQGNRGSGVETVGVEKNTRSGGAKRGETSFSTTETFDTFGHKSMENRLQDTGSNERLQKTGLLGDTHNLESQNPESITNHQSPKIIITHGQMPGEEIEDRIHAFKRGEYDILLTTTIIENGVNFLRANTIIIIDPEDFGLAQLHQLRGRVGRKGEQGYCYLMYRKPELASIEKERIITIANNTHLGAGFEIAMRDMEIRGAGDVLGFKQAGKSKDIGLTLYFKLLEEKIEELREQKARKKPVKIELELSYTLDDELFGSELDKLNFFREIESVENLEELEEIEQEIEVASRKLLDNSDSENNLVTSNSHLATHHIFLLLRARIIFSEYELESLKKVGQNYIFDFYEGTRVELIRGFLDRFDAKNRMTLLSVRKIRTETRYWKSAAEFLGEILY